MEMNVFPWLFMLYKRSVASRKRKNVSPLQFSVVISQEESALGSYFKTEWVYTDRDAHKRL